MKPSKKILEVKNLVKSFGYFTLKELNFYIFEGEIFGLIGPNGSGKTTTLKLVAGLLFKDKGEIKISEVRVNQGDDTFKKNLGFIPDTPFVYPYLSGYEHLLFTAQLYGIDKKKAIQRIKFFIELLDMEHWIHTLSRDYSFGMRQKVSIAAGLLHSPSFLIIDEPLAALDPKSVYSFKKFLIEEKKNGKGILLSTHSLSFAEEICDRIGILINGNLVECDSISSLVRKYNTENLEHVFLKISKK